MRRTAERLRQTDAAAHWRRECSVFVYKESGTVERCNDLRRTIADFCDFAQYSNSMKSTSEIDASRVSDPLYSRIRMSRLPRPL
jgi:hypothetical protein